MDDGATTLKKLRKAKKRNGPSFYYLAGRREAKQQEL